MQNCEFRRADLTSARFDRADLRQSSFWKATLCGSSFQNARLNIADLEGADLTGARFNDAATMGANLRGANLRAAQGLTQTQLGQARTDRETILPDGSHGPFLLGSALPPLARCPHPAGGHGAQHRRHAPAAGP